MDYWLIVIGATLLLLALFAEGMSRLRKWWENRNRGFPYVKRPLLTASELRFFREMECTVGPEYLIIIKPRLADLFEVNEAGRWGDFCRISQKHVDFVVLDQKTMEPVVALELDDRSHQRKDRIERDKFVNAVFEGCGLPLLRIPVGKAYCLEKLRLMLERKEQSGWRNLKAG